MAGEARADEMRRGGGNTQETDLAVYAELHPMDRHRPFIDHLFILRDRGRLTGAGTPDEALSLAPHR